MACVCVVACVSLLVRCCSHCSVHARDRHVLTTHTHTHTHTHMQTRAYADTCIRTSACFCKCFICTYTRAYMHARTRGAYANACLPSTTCIHLSLSLLCLYGSSSSYDMYPPPLSYIFLFLCSASMGPPETQTEKKRSLRFHLPTGSWGQYLLFACGFDMLLLSAAQNRSSCSHCCRCVLFPSRAHIESIVGRKYSTPDSHSQKSVP
jgi:hypothetical protein